MTTERIVIQVNAEGAEQADKSIAGIGKSADNSQKAVVAMQRILGTLVTAATIKKIIDYGDAWVTINNRIRLVTSSQNELKAVTQALLDVSNRTRTDMKTTAELYQRMASNAKGLGLSQRDLIGVTETIGQTLAISGASAESANAALVQLSQGIAANALRGQELNSVMEQTPRLAQAIADGLGIELGALRKIAAEGKISAEEVINALQSQAAKVNEEFAKITPTVAQAMTVANNQMTMFVGELMDASSGTEFLANAIIDLSMALDADLAIASVNGYFEQWRVTIHQVTGETAGLSNEFQFLGDVTGSFFEFLGNSFANFPSNVKAMTQILTVEILHWAQAIPLMLDAELTKADIAFAKFVQTTVLSFILGMKEMKLSFKEWIHDTFGIDTSEAIQGLTSDIAALEATLADVANGGTANIQEYQKELDATQNTIEAMTTARRDSIVAILDERDAAIAAGAQIKEDILERRKLEREANLDKPLGEERPKIREFTEEEIKKAQKAALEIAEAAAEQSAALLEDFQSTLSDTLQAGFKGDTDSIREMWSKLLLDMATQALAADIMNILLPNREGAAGSGTEAVFGRIGDLISSGGASSTTEGQVGMAGGLPFPGQGIAGPDGLAIVAESSGQHAETIKQNMGGVFDFLKGGFGGITESAGGFIDKFLGGAEAAGQTLSTDVVGGIKGVQQASAAASAAQQAQSATATATSTTQAATTASAWTPAATMTSVASFGTNVAMAMAQMLVMSTLMKSISQFADGGIVNSPQLFNNSGGLGLRGEAGPEAIVPLPDGRSIPVKMKGEKSESGTSNGGNQGNMTNVNLIDPDMVPALLNTPSGTKAVLNIISQNPDAVSQAVNGG
jgi:tape measure domain-containing protein